MSQYVYGIVEAAAAPPPVVGVAGAAPVLVAGDGIAALVGELSDHEPRLGRDDVLAHSRVLEGALAHGTVLPMRFGVVLEDADAVRDRLLEPHGPALREALGRFAGQAEYRLRVTYREESLLREVLAHRQDIARLRERLAGQDEHATYFERIRLGELIAEAVTSLRTRDADALLAALTPFAADVVVEDAPHERVALAASFLVPRSGQADFDDVLEGLAESHNDRMTFKLTGPLAPHSFVELGGNG